MKIKVNDVEIEIDDNLKIEIEGTKVKIQSKGSKEIQYIPYWTYPSYTPPIIPYKQQITWTAACSTGETIDGNDQTSFLIS